MQIKECFTKMGTCNNDRTNHNSAQQALTKLKCELEDTSDMFIITDGEPALIAAILNFFKKCKLLRCTRHFENNCKDYLKQIGIRGSMEDVMLDVVFGEMD